MKSELLWGIWPESAWELWSLHDVQGQRILCTTCPWALAKQDKEGVTSSPKRRQKLNSAVVASACKRSGASEGDIYPHSGPAWPQLQSTHRSGQMSRKGKKDTKGKGLMNHSLMNQFRIGLDQWFSYLTDLRTPEKLVKLQIPDPPPPLHLRFSRIRIWSWSLGLYI